MYLEEPYQGRRMVLGDLLQATPIDKCLIYTMKSEKYRDNITLNEVMRIINVSKKIISYKDPYEDSEKRDMHGRKLIWTKYKTLVHTEKNT